MKYSTKLSDAVHILAFIVLNPNGSLTSDSIAESVHTNPGCVRQLMSSLRRAGLISSVKGHPKPSLTKELSTITLLDIYRAVERESLCFIWILILIRNAVLASIFSCLFRIFLTKSRKKQKKK